VNGFHAQGGEECRAGLGTYERPLIRDHGTLTQITADQGMLLDVTRMSLGLVAAAVSSPLVPGGDQTTTPGSNGGVAAAGSVDAPNVTTTTTTPSPSPDAGETLGRAGTDPGLETTSGSDPGGSAGSGGSGGSGGGSGTGGGSGDGGRLPFTGLAVIGMAALGAAATGTGAALRRLARRNRAPGAGS